MKTPMLKSLLLALALALPALAPAQLNPSMSAPPAKDVQAEKFLLLRHIRDQQHKFITTVPRQRVEGKVPFARFVETLDNLAFVADQNAGAFERGDELG